MSAGSAAHKKLVRALWRALGRRPDVRLWPQATGQGVPMATIKAALGRLLRGPLTAQLLREVFGRLARMKFGVKGGGDLSGALMPDGRRIEVEAKTGDGKPKPGQRAFRAMIEKFGGLYILVHAADDADIDRAVAEAVSHVQQEIDTRRATRVLTARTADDSSRT